MAYEVRKVDVEAVNATVAEISPHRSRHLKRNLPKLSPKGTSTDWQKDYQSKRLDNWQHTARGQQNEAKLQGG